MKSIAGLEEKQDLAFLYKKQGRNTEEPKEDAEMIEVRNQEREVS